MDKTVSPFETYLSFNKIMEEWKKVAVNENSLKGEYAKKILNELESKCDLIDGFNDNQIVYRNETLIGNIIELAYPSTGKLNIFVFSKPFDNFYFLPSDAFNKLIAADFHLFSKEIEELSFEYLYITKCLFILKRCFNVNVDIDFVKSFSFRDQRGILRRYRIEYDLEYVEIVDHFGNQKLSQTVIDNLLSNLDNINLWQDVFPPNSWTIKGFSVIHFIDVTQEAAFSDIKSMMINPDSQRSQSVNDAGHFLESVFNISDLKGVLYIFDQGLTFFEMIHMHSGNENIFDLLKNFGRDSLIKTFFDVIDSEQPKFWSNTETSSDSIIRRLFSDYHIGSFCLAPVVNNDSAKAVLLLWSEKKNDINALLYEKILLLTPILEDTLERVLIEMEHYIDAVIQKEYTAIHSSVYWKFRQEVMKKSSFFNFEGAHLKQSFTDLVFNHVYNIYGHTDIVNSSDIYNEVIKQDLLCQLEALVEICQSNGDLQAQPAVKEIVLKLQYFTNALQTKITNSLEEELKTYLIYHIHPLLEHSKCVKSESNLIDKYFQNINSRTGIFDKAQKLYREDVAAINLNLVGILDERQVQAQNIFPHYYERFKTDGVDHNIYIGSSLNKDKKFTTEYVDNLRLWQLETVARMAHSHRRLKDKLFYKLDVASLIIVASSSISIRFRIDEKKFDVDGSNNAKYEILKKRVEKAFKKGTQERITQKDKITIVYSADSEYGAYVNYISILQKKGFVANFETIDVEDLKGIVGLKALIVSLCDNM